MQKDFEARLALLETRAQHDEERWQSLEADLKGFSIIIDSIGAVVGASHPAALATIIKNLSSFESEARLLNSHAVTVSRIRETRSFFEKRAENMKKRRKP